MKRLLALGLAGLSLAHSGGGVQHMPAGKAVVYTVVSVGEAARFRVPQVRVPDAAVARRINHAVLKQIFIEPGTLPVAFSGSAAQALRLTQKACYINQETGSVSRPVDWLVARIVYSTTVAGC